MAGFRGANHRPQFFASLPLSESAAVVAGDAYQAGSDQAFGTKLVSDQEIVVERAMYWGTDGGHVTAGIRG